MTADFSNQELSAYHPNSQFLKKYLALIKYTFDVIVPQGKINYIAELSGNHNGSLERAKSLVKAAAEAGASSVKFQTYTADTMTLDIEKFKVSDNHELWGGRKLFDLYEEAHTPWEWHQELFDLAESLNVVPFSTPFDLTALRFLEKLNAKMYKIASLETGDHLLIQKTAETGKPILISTGATEWEEIEDLVNVVLQTGNRNLILLLCTSSYPAKPQDANLNRMIKLREKFGVEVGLSDHTLGIGVSIAAIALGAVAIEKHFTISRADGGVDSQFSLEPAEFKSLVIEGDAARESLGNSEWISQESEKESRSLRRSLYIVSDVKKGELITLNNVRAIRPNGGMKPKFLNNILGKQFKDSYSIGTALTYEMISD